MGNWNVELDQARDILQNAAWLGTNEDRERIEKAVELLCGEPCEDAISRGVFEQVMCERDVAIDQLKELGYGFGEKQKTGHWIFDEILDKHYYCSECKSMGVDYWDYCPNCGAKMVEPQESEDKE